LWGFLEMCPVDLVTDVIATRLPTDISNSTILM